jgi:uncharacterized protein (DUF58 family)
MQTNSFLADPDRRWLRVHRLWYVAAGVLFVLSLLTLQPLLFLAALLILVIGFVPAWWYRQALCYLVVRQQVRAPRLFPGDETVFEVRLENQKTFPLPWLTCEIQVRPLLPTLTQALTRSETIGLIDNSSVLWSFQRVTRRYRLRCAARGLYTFGPLTLSSADPFGWMKRQATLPLLDTLLVYPPVVSLEALGLPPLTLFGEEVSVHPLFEDPLRVIGVRDYQVGDDPRRIHWKATARTGSLHSKIYEYTNQRRLLLLLDVGDEAMTLLETSREMQEFSIAVAASLALSALDEHYLVGALINCAWLTSPERVSASHTAVSRQQDVFKTTEMAPPGIIVPFASERGHDERLLATFARLVPSISVSMAALIERERALFSPGTQVILVSTAKVLTQATLEWLLEIHEHGSHLQVIVTGDLANERGTEINHLPIHYLGGREQWHALIRSFVEEKNQAGDAKAVHFQLD